jgi:hypothetical protein
MARGLQKFRFRLFYYWRWLFQMPFAVVLCPLFRRFALGSYRGICICRASFSTRISGEQFCKGTLEALQLIERVDPRRFRRIQQQIRIIVHSELVSGATYKRVGRICDVDYTRYKLERDHDWYLRCYASALVHEATHGVLYSRFVAYTARNRLRTEKLCQLEERRFLRRLDTPDRCWSDEILGEFDTLWYEQHYRTGQLSKALQLRKRISEVRDA